MPELPEVETIVTELRKEILGRVFFDVWTDFEKMIKRPKSFGEFREGLKKKIIIDIKRRGKNILINLSQNKTILIHQKLTGHLLLGKWKAEDGRWKSLIPGPLSDDPINRFLHLIFFLDDKRQLALSDLRKFAKVELWDRNDLENSKEFKSLGPEPLERNFTVEKFKEVLKKKKKGRIKQVLMDQNLIAGIGNIYSDEILWEAKIHPLKEIERLSDGEINKIYATMRKILKKAIEVHGESISDFRRISGEKGNFDPLRRVYRQEGEKCFRCGSAIKRLKITGRSAHFCPECQIL